MLVELYALVVVPLSVLVCAVFLLLALAEPSVAYRVAAPAVPPRDPAFCEQLAILCGAVQRRVAAIEVLSCGEAFYREQIEAIRRATRSVHLEAYIFRRGHAGARFIEALTERARAGIEVRLTLDAFGNLFTPSSYFRALRAAGGQVEWYQPLRWYTLKRFNNRTHRELLVVDTEVAFVGGAGIADWWIGAAGRPPWRDTVLRFRGPLVSVLQSVFAENWLAASGEVLFGARYFPALEAETVTVEDAGPAPLGFIVPSTPSDARATRARLLFQVLVAAARHTIRIQTPYFVPDRSAVRELLRAAERGVAIEILVPGKWNNHKATRLASRARYGRLLRAGIVLREYTPSMIHTKSLVVDDHVCAVGSSNWDNRSASLNDELNLVVASDAVSARLVQDFDRDASTSRTITYEEWRWRGLVERIGGAVAGLLARQE